MLYSEYELLLNEGTEFGFDPGLSINNFKGLCAVNDVVALPLTTTSPKYERDAIISIVRTGTNNSIGLLLTCKGQGFGYGQASAQLVAAYLLDAELTDVVDSQGNFRRDFKFKTDYVAVEISNHDEYILHYRAGSGLWGTFTHREDQPNHATPHVMASSTTLITATADTEVRTDAEKDALWRSIRYFSPFERYLKLYHLLELYFDLHLVEQLRGLNGDLKGIGKLLNSYSGDKEFDRLVKVVKTYCTDVPFFERVLTSAFNDPIYHQQWHEILFEYAKESNPYKEQGANFTRAIANGFSNAEWTNNGLKWQYEHLAKFATYMIYRVRSSIAHFRIGEYLFTSDDEGFVAEAAEPLLREIVLAAYKRTP